MKVIDADKLKAEINGIIKAITTNGHPDVLGTEAECIVAAENEALNLVLETIDTLQKELPTLQELDAAAIAYSKRVTGGRMYRDLIAGFIDGSKWMEEQLKEDKK